MAAQPPAIGLRVATPAETAAPLPWRAWLTRRIGLTRLLLVVALLVLWEVAVRAFGDPLFVASPIQIVQALPTLLALPGIPDALLVTGWELAFAFALAAAAGIAIGLAVGLSSFARLSCLPIIMLMYATPQVTILPIFMILFGIGPASKVAYGFSHGVFPIIVTVAAGVQNLKPILLVSSRSMGASRAQILRHVLLPHMLPSLFTGFRLGMTATLLGVILAELYVSRTGVGFFSKKFALGFDPQMLFALIAVVAAMAILLNEVIRRAELRLTRWRAP